MPRKTELPVAGNRGVRIRLPRRGSVVVRGFAIRRCERIHRAFSSLVLTGDRGFESISLHRRVCCEPDFRGPFPSSLGIDSDGGPRVRTHSLHQRVMSRQCAGCRQLRVCMRSRRQALGRRNTELDKLKEQRRQLVEDEKRLRDNLAAVGHDTALYKQTLDKLGETEASITTLSTAIEHISAEIEVAKEQLQAFVSALTL